MQLTRVRFELRTSAIWSHSSTNCTKATGKDYFSHYTLGRDYLELFQKMSCFLNRIFVITTPANYTVRKLNLKTIKESILLNYRFDGQGASIWWIYNFHRQQFISTYIPTDRDHLHKLFGFSLSIFICPSLYVSLLPSNYFTIVFTAIDNRPNKSFSFESTIRASTFRNKTNGSTKIFFDGQWLWLSWKNGRLRHQRYAVRSQSSANFILLDTKILLKRPGMAQFLKICIGNSICYSQLLKPLCPRWISNWFTTELGR